MSKALAPFTVSGEDPQALAKALRELAFMLESGKLAVASGGLLLSHRQHPTEVKTAEITVFSDLVLRAKQ